MTTIPLHVTELRGGEGVPIVMLHGFMGSGLDFEGLASASDFPDRRVIAVDLPNHGESGDFEAEFDFADVVESILTAVTDERFDLVGYSMGGRLAMYLCGTHPERVRSMVLLAGHPGIEHPGIQRGRLQLDEVRAALLVEDPAIFVDEWGHQDLFGPRIGPAWSAAQARRRETAESHGFGWSRMLVSLSVGRQLMLWNVPHMTATPTLYVVGGMDERYIEIGKQLVEENSDHVELALIGNAYHASHLDQPGPLAKRLARFWSESLPH